MDEKLLTPIEAAGLKGVSRSAVYGAVTDGRLAHVRILGRIGIRLDDVTAWEPVQYAERPGVKGKGGRPAGKPQSDETRLRLSEAAKTKWEQRRLSKNTP